MLNTKLHGELQNRTVTRLSELIVQNTVNRSCYLNTIVFNLFFTNSNFNIVIMTCPNNLQKVIETQYNIYRKNAWKGQRLSFTF